VPDWAVGLWKTLFDGMAYDAVKYLFGSLIVAAVVAVLGKLTNRLESKKEAFYVGAGTFIVALIFLFLVSPRSQTPQLSPEP
jgi:uncharacterized membrane protein YkvI